MDPHLNNTLVAVCRLHHFAALIDRQAQRLFAVDILAGVAGFDHLQGMPMVGSGDHHSVQGLVFDQLPPVGIALGRVMSMVLGLLFGEIHVGGLQVAKCSGSVIAELEKTIVHLVAPVADADVAYHHSIVCAHHLPIAQRRHGTGSCKIPPGRIVH